MAAEIATFENLYEQFIIKQYGRNFFKYTLYVNVGIIIFLMAILSMSFYTETASKQ
jgi:hypothetical protein